MSVEAPPPRLCHLTKWPNFDGYGFNLHAEKNKPGQFIGNIDKESPAEAAGLKEGDRIVEVNGVNVSQENHKQVVQRIKAVKLETRLLVVDRKCEEWHREHNTVIRSNLPYVITSSSEPQTIPTEDDELIDTRLQNVELKSEAEDIETVNVIQESEATTSSVERDNSIRSKTSVASLEIQGSTSVSSGSYRSTPSPTDTPDIGLNLNMTAKEMRELLGSQKKKDPRKDAGRHDMKKKFEMIQAL